MCAPVQNCSLAALATFHQVPGKVTPCLSVLAVQAMATSLFYRSLNVFLCERTGRMCR